jgi:hypothetical protein
LCFDFYMIEAKPENLIGDRAYDSDPLDHALRQDGIEMIAPPDNSVFVNGALAVPGAPANTDTVPAKFSEKNAADDKLITLAYTFKLLTDEQRRAIYEGLKGQEAGPAFNADVGVQLPSSIELRPVPNDVAARVPQTKDYRYAVADNRVLLVSPVGRFVVGVFMDDVQAPRAGEGGRTP